MNNKLLFLVGLFFILFSIGIFLGQWGKIYKSYDAEKNWFRIPCKINSFFIEKNYESSGKCGATETYSINIHYNYHYNNKIYQGNRYSFWKKTEYINSLSKITKKLNSESDLKCFVNPKNPKESVIDPHIYIFWISTPFFVFISFFIMGGILIFLSMPLDFHNKEKKGII